MFPGLSASGHFTWCSLYLLNNCISSTCKSDFLIVNEKIFLYFARDS